jgi:hypothetical protein
MRSTGFYHHVEKKFEKKRKQYIVEMMEERMSYSNSYTKIIRDILYFQNISLNLPVHDFLKIYDFERDFIHLYFGDIEKTFLEYYNVF